MITCAIESAGSDWVTIRNQSLNKAFVGTMGESWYDNRFGKMVMKERPKRKGGYEFLPKVEQLKENDIDIDFYGAKKIELSNDPYQDNLLLCLPLEIFNLIFSYCDSDFVVFDLPNVCTLFGFIITQKKLSLLSTVTLRPNKRYGKFRSRNTSMYNKNDVRIEVFLFYGNRFLDMKELILWGHNHDHYMLPILGSRLFGETLSLNVFKFIHDNLHNLRSVSLETVCIDLQYFKKLQKLEKVNLANCLFTKNPVKEVTLKGVVDFEIMNIRRLVSERYNFCFPFKGTFNLPNSRRIKITNCLLTKVVSGDTEEFSVNRSSGHGNSRYDYNGTVGEAVKILEEELEVLRLYKPKKLRFLRICHVDVKGKMLQGFSNLEKIELYLPKLKWEKVLDDLPKFSKVKYASIGLHQFNSAVATGIILSFPNVKELKFSSIKPIIGISLIPNYETVPIRMLIEGLKELEVFQFNCQISDQAHTEMIDYIMSMSTEEFNRSKLSTLRLFSWIKIGELCKTLGKYSSDTICKRMVIFYDTNDECDEFVKILGFLRKYSIEWNVKDRVGKGFEIPNQEKIDLEKMFKKFAKMEHFSSLKHSNQGYRVDTNDINSGVFHCKDCSQEICSNQEKLYPHFYHDCKNHSAKGIDEDKLDYLVVCMVCKLSVPYSKYHEHLEEYHQSEKESDDYVNIGDTLTKMEYFLPGMSSKYRKELEIECSICKKSHQSPSGYCINENKVVHKKTDYIDYDLYCLFCRNVVRYSSYRDHLEQFHKPCRQGRKKSWVCAHGCGELGSSINYHGNFNDHFTNCKLNITCCPMCQEEFHFNDWDKHREICEKKDVTYHMCEYWIEGMRERIRKRINGKLMNFG